MARKHNILVADDDQGNLNSISKYLEINGFLVEKAQNGAEALQIFNNNSNGFSLCIIDKNMPELDGLSCISEIRKTRKSIPVFLMSGDQSGDEFKDLSINKILQKPFNWDEMVKNINKTIEK